MDASLLELICCPQTHQLLKPLGSEQLAELNQRISQGGVTTVSGQPVKTLLSAGLIREDGRIIYPILEGIPVLLAEEGIPV